MSDPKAANAANAEAANAASEQEVTTTQESASEVNARLLEESKQNKKLAREYKAKLEEVEKAKLQEQEKYKELWQKSEEKFKGLYKTLITEKVKTAVADKASKAGAVDIDAIMVMGNKELLQVDEETLEVHGTDTYVEELKKMKPYLFKTISTTQINSTTPGGVVQKKEVTLGDLAKRPNTDAAKNAAWAAAFGNKK